MDEFDIIRRHFAPLAAGFSGARDLRDDAALLDIPAGMQLVVTKDAICEGVHFIGDETPDLIARKLLRTNLSDLAAKGAKPLCYFLATAVPSDADEHFFKEFAQGLAHDQTEFGIALAGGDTTSSQNGKMFSLTAMGLVPKGAMLTRSGAKAGELLCVSGTIGDGALGLMATQNTLTGELTVLQEEQLKQRYLLPQPRVALGQALRGIASACMDISDGLVQDAAHLCTASHVSAQIEAANVPLSQAALSVLEQNPELRETVLTGGDDYELLFTLPEDKLARAEALGTPITVIGKIREGEGVHVSDRQGHELIFARTGYKHF